MSSLAAYFAANGGIMIFECVYTNTTWKGTNTFLPFEVILKYLCLFPLRIPKCFTLFLTWKPIPHSLGCRPHFSYVCTCLPIDILLSKTYCRTNMQLVVENYRAVKVPWYQYQWYFYHLQLFVPSCPPVHLYTIYIGP